MGGHGFDHFQATPSANSCCVVAARSFVCQCSRWSSAGGGAGKKACGRASSARRASRTTWRRRRPGRGGARPSRPRCHCRRACSARAHGNGACPFARFGLLCAMQQLVGRGCVTLVVRAERCPPCGRGSCEWGCCCCCCCCSCCCTCCCCACFFFFSGGRCGCRAERCRRRCCCYCSCCRSCCGSCRCCAPRR